MAQLWIFTQVHYRHHCVYIQASQSLLKLQASLWKSHRTPQGVLLTLSLGCDNNCKATAPSFEESDQLNNKSNIVQFTFGAPEHCVCVRKRERGRSFIRATDGTYLSLSLWLWWGWGGWARHRMHSLSNSQHSPLHCLSYEALFMLRSPMPLPQLNYNKGLLVLNLCLCQCTVQASSGDFQ